MQTNNVSFQLKKNHLWLFGTLFQDYWFTSKKNQTLENMYRVPEETDTSNSSLSVDPLECMINESTQEKINGNKNKNHSQELSLSISELKCYAKNGHLNDEFDNKHISKINQVASDVPKANLTEVEHSLSCDSFYSFESEKTITCENDTREKPSDFILSHEHHYAISECENNSLIETIDIVKCKNKQIDKDTEFMNPIISQVQQLSSSVFCHGSQNPEISQISHDAADGTQIDTGNGEINNLGTLEFYEKRIVESLMKNKLDSKPVDKTSEPDLITCKDS